jgi:putative hemolysin
MRFIALAFALSIAACSSPAKPVAQPDPTTTEPPPPADPSQTGNAALTPDECTAKGGTVKGDIGDGQVACAEGETELGKVATGVEGGLCCGK